MEIKDLQGKLVGILGFGVEGKATAAYLLKHGVKPALFDQKSWGQWPQEDREYFKSLGLNFIFGQDAFKELAGFDVVFRSPGIKLPEIKSNLPGVAVITSQTKWFFEHCPAKIIGITGTKGKGTTASLIYEMIRSNGRRLKANCYLTGNIGKVQPLEILDDLNADDWVVYELSSFQLQDLTQSPHIAVVLMVTGEHLDYHKTIKEYHKAKTSIVKFQQKGDIAIINRDFPASMSTGSYGKGRKLFFSRSKPVADGCFVKNEAILTANNNFRFPVSQLQLRGRHNLENVCAAILAAFAAGCSAQSIKNVLKKFFNDSFSTTPETCIAAIESFSEPLVVILGGSTKNSNFHELGKALARAKNIKGLILIGREAGRIKDAVSSVKGFKGKIFEGAKNMEEIFVQIKQIGSAGDVVLLSPACASFDMFQSYTDRGNQFIKAVKSF
jgi:UDP-N-acetylmuramoylalanine--D-glutamate ligase